MNTSVSQSAEYISRLSFALLTLALWCRPSHLLAQPIFLDAIVASIDDKPIALSDVTKRMKLHPKLTVQEAANDPDFTRTLDGLILENLVEIEASQRKLTVVDEEVNEYLNEIAKRNSLSRDEFLAALKRENHSEEEYRFQVKSDILRSKLASSLSRGAVVVSDEEIDAALNKDQETPKTTGDSVSLRQILISREKHDEESAERLIEKLREKLADGEKFDDLARTYSDSPEGSDGGSLGTLQETDLQSDIRDAIQSIDVGEVSETVKSPQGYHLFLLEERSEAPDSEEPEKPTTSKEERERVRAALKQEKLESKMTEFFTTELYKLHSVDKKI